VVAWTAPGTIVFLWVTRTSPGDSRRSLYAFPTVTIPLGIISLSGTTEPGRSPSLAMVGFVYWWWFAIGMFWLERTGRRIMDTESVDGAMWLALVGVVCMGVGMRVRVTPLPPSRHLNWTTSRLVGCTSDSFW